MKRFLIVLLLLFITVWVGVEIATDPGYVLITRNKLAIEMPLWLASLGLLISFILLYFLIRLLQTLIALPKRWAAWRQRKHQQKQTAIDDQTLLAALLQTPPDWENIAKRLADLEKKNWLSQTQLFALKRGHYEHVLTQAMHTDMTQFSETWQRLPYTWKKDPTFLNLFIQALLQHHEIEKAELTTRKLLKKNWLAPLVHTYGLICSKSPERQLAYAEKWLKQHPDDPILLLSLGRICKRLRLWGKARDYLETSLSHDPTNPETHQELGELFETLGDPLAALSCLKKMLRKYN